MIQKNNIFRKGLALACIGAAILAGQAKAATITYNNEDLLVGFFSSNAAITQEYIVDVGNFSTLTAGTLGNISSDLTTVFGAGWASNTTINWGVFASANNAAVGTDPINTLYATTTTGSAAVLAKKASLQSGPAGSIYSVGFSIASNGGATTVNTLATVIQSASLSNSFKVKAGSNAFAIGNAQMGGIANTLDLYQLIPNASFTGSPGTKELSFSVTGTGNLVYGSQAVPDAGSTVSFLGLAMMGLALLRRRLA